MKFMLQQEFELVRFALLAESEFSSRRSIGRLQERVAKSSSIVPLLLLPSKSLSVRLNALLLAQIFLF